MSRELYVGSFLKVTKGWLQYESKPRSFFADMAGLSGPTPGALLIPTSGVDVSLAKLTLPGGLCRIVNVDDTSWVEYGIKDQITGAFYPLGEVLPGESYVVRLSRYIGTDEPGTGTLTAGTTTLHMQARPAPAQVVVEAFDA